MLRRNEDSDLELVAKALQAISEAMSYRALAEVLLSEALRFSKTARDAVLLSEGAGAGRYAGCELS
jgi:hypothetical protein